MGDHVRELIRPGPATLATAFPQHAARVRRTLEELDAAELSWGPLPVAPLHRDFHLRQLFDDGEHITVLDWDDAASGDAAFDVGYLTAYLRSHHGDDAAASGIAAFRAGYGGDPALWSRVRVYERFNFLRRACRRLRLQDRGWDRELAAMMSRLD
jgi:aminoglycoside phosphotransferase (APT) family kinase protein